jgi:hypothetical protein
MSFLSKNDSEVELESQAWKDKYEAEKQAELIYCLGNMKTRLFCVRSCEIREKGRRCEHCEIELAKLEADLSGAFRWAGKLGK